MAGAIDDDSPAATPSADEPVDPGVDPRVDAELDPVELIEHARRRHGAVGGIVAAGMFGLDQALGRKVKQEAPIVVSAPTEPVDIDSEGIEVVIDDVTSLVAPALPRSAPLPSGQRSSPRSDRSAARRRARR